MTDPEFSWVCMSENKICIKDLCWSVWMMDYDPRELSGVSTDGPKVDRVLQKQIGPSVRSYNFVQVLYHEAWTL
jgi:hypothetical protein